jgi:hypothetical protein
MLPRILHLLGFVFFVVCAGGGAYTAKVTMDEIEQVRFDEGRSSVTSAHPKTITDLLAQEHSATTAPNLPTPPRPTGSPAVTVEGGATYDPSLTTSGIASLPAVQPNIFLVALVAALQRIAWISLGSGVLLGLVTWALLAGVAVTLSTVRRLERAASVIRPPALAR